METPQVVPTYTLKDATFVGPLNGRQIGEATLFTSEGAKVKGSVHFSQKGPPCIQPPSRIQPINHTHTHTHTP